MSEASETREVDTASKQISDGVLVWMLSSMEPIIRDQVETLTTPAEVWSELERQFAGKSNKMQATRIMHELTHLKQGSRSVVEYVGEVKKLYRDLHYYHPFEAVDKKDLAIHHTWFQSFVSKLFLDGLNQEFDLRRQLIFSKSKWPTLDEIISSIIEEETRLSHPKVDDYKAVDVSVALSLKKGRISVPRGDQEKNKVICDHCGDKGHTIEKCFKLHGFPPGWKKGGKSQPGGVRGANWNRANHIASEKELPVVDAQALEKYNSKLKLSEGSSSTQGASNLFTSYIPCSGKDKVRVADGSMVPITGCGSIRS
ncbi:uncharacterized protein [Miscanthus floridulus]|uniref:uncharacterized protein n=1 Tax=Miscanthus floridulus TaxID=154761 RepID=UPI00345A1495